MADKINHPAHYTQGNIECIDYIEDKLTAEEFRGYIKGNVIKYLTREKHKNGDEDIEKATWYLSRLAAELDKKDLLISESEPGLDGYCRQCGKKLYYDDWYLIDKNGDLYCSDTCAYRRFGLKEVEETKY